MPRTPPAPLLSVTFGGGFTVARVAPAELTHENAARLGDELSALAGTAPRLVVDLRAVGFIGSGGLAALLAARHRAAEAGGSLTLVNVRPGARRVLAVTRMDRVLDFRPARNPGPEPPARPAFRVPAGSRRPA